MHLPPISSVTLPSFALSVMSRQHSSALLWTSTVDKIKVIDTDVSKILQNITWQHIRIIDSPFTIDVWAANLKIILVFDSTDRISITPIYLGLYIWIVRVPGSDRWRCHGIARGEYEIDMDIRSTSLSECHHASSVQNMKWENRCKKLKKDDEEWREINFFYLLL